MLNFLQSEPPEPTTSAEYSPTKYSDLTPKEFFLGKAKQIRTESESMRSKINAQFIVQMCRRHRSMTPADMFGYWRNGVWCESVAYDSLHGVPLFQQLIVGAESNYTNAEIRLDITANSNKYQSIANICRDIYEVLETRQWTEAVKQAEFYAKILMLNAFYISRINKEDGDDISKPKFDDIAYEQNGTGVCTECYTPADMGSQAEQKCPNCGGETLSALSDPTTTQDQVVAGFDKQKGGETEMVIANGLEVSVDPNGKPADIKSCGWVEWRVMSQKAELKRLYPHLELNGTPKWSYQTGLRKALQRYQAGIGGIFTESDKTEFEVRNIWLDATEYEDQVAPDDLKLGKQMIIKRGDKYIEKFPDGIVFGLINEEIAFLECENKNKRISSSLWISDGIMFEGLGARAGLTIQRKINQLENIAMEGETRSLKGSAIYNSEAIEGSALEGANTNIPTKQDFSQGTNPLSNYVLPLKVEGLSQETLTFMANQKQTMQEIMGTPDVVLGQDTAADKTYGGQALRSRNALGLLTPKTQSTARAKELWLSHQFDLIQNYYSPEALRQFGRRNGAEWQDEEIEELLEADLDECISIAYVPGTEVPESRFEKGMRLRADISAGFVPLTSQLKQRLASESNFDDLDVDDYNSNLKLAEKRFTFIKNTIEKNRLDGPYQQYEAQMVDPQTGVRAADQTGQPIPNPVMQQLLNAPELIIYQFAENGAEQVSYWSQKVRDIAGADDNQSPMLLAMANAMITKHNAAIMQLGIVAAATQGTQAAAMQAPAAIGGHMLHKDAAEHAQSIQPPPPPQQQAPPPEPHPADQAKQTIIESIKLPDLPASGQKQLTDHIGLDIPLADFKEKVKIDNPPPPPKVAAKPVAKK